MKACYGTHGFFAIICIVWLFALGCEAPTVKSPRVAALQPPLPPMPVKSASTPTVAPTLKLARSSMVVGLPPVNDWGTCLAAGMGDIWVPTNGMFLIGDRVRAHRWMIYLIEGKTEPALIPEGKNWLMTTNQAQEFLFLADKLRKEGCLAVYAPGAE